MWVFAFGSLMADGWERDFDCLSRVRAELLDHRRSFNKKSVENWGTPEHPGLTLVLEKAEGESCTGFAFEFAGDALGKEVRAYLRKREACDPTMHPVKLFDGRQVQAHVYVYAGKNLLPAGTTAEERARLVLSAAKGSSGTGIDYVQKTFGELERAGVDDPVVTALWTSIKIVA